MIFMVAKAKFCKLVLVETCTLSALLTYLALTCPPGIRQALESRRWVVAAEPGLLAGDPVNLNSGLQIFQDQ